MRIFKFGETQLGLPLHAYQWLTEPKNPHVLIIGGVHGDEPEGVVCARGLLQKFIENFDFKLNLTLIPEFNPEGVLLKTRGNSNAVDLNRNLPTKDWSPLAATARYYPGPNALSEKENQALVQFLKTEKIDVIYSLHSWKPMLNTNGDIPEAQIISQMTGYVIEPDIGYPTPGSLGTYAGFENNIPTLTYEIERDIPFDHILRIHVPAIIAGLKISEGRKK
jgi:murein peptide amidase A